MRVSCAWSLGLLAGVAAAKLQITLPNAHTEWRAGTTETIKWKAVDGNLSGRVSIELMEGNDPSNLNSVATIVENVAAGSQQAYWSVPKNLKASKNYAIKIVDESGDDFYGQFFRGTAVKGAQVKQALRAEQSEAPKQRTAHELSSTVAEPKSASQQTKSTALEHRASGTMAMHREDASVSGAAGRAGMAAAAVAACVAAAL
ncbi:hypothetical protein LPJ61_001529 [Coemansia biformis]|uniref:Yeast cell wall synthesis Kre9/Knh1-like N-terminal domain-containing protein n=1 Tax=Coemansia biformis TaxID=1286918 RepID=A0A9W7YF03_9FUNG|nr:hypothetical protein LPJ61_001529 [Coemansia biformis]